MKIANEFTVSAPAARAWDVLTDLEQVVPLMPGAQLVGQEGDDYLGKVKVKVGPVTSEFSGKAHFVDRDAEAHRAVVNARGKEARGSGNATATITLAVHEAGAHSRVTVDTDLRVVGKLAQFGGGMLQQVSEKLLGQFVDSLEAKLAGRDEAGEVPIGSSDSEVVAAPAPQPIDLLELAGGGALKKYGPAVFGAFVLAAILFTLGRLWLGRKALRGR
ncbi:MAG TPA: SRPBCC family protein [Mycobacterium sp.]|nr:SRPBCC family protein [Mycobacterium sp.]